MAYDQTTSPIGARLAAFSPENFTADAERIVAQQMAARAAWRPIGVRWGGLTENTPPKVESVQAVADRLAQMAEARAAFRATPRGHLLTAIETLEREGHHADAGMARSAYWRGIDDDRFPPNPDEIACIRRLLSPIDSPAASAALAALDMISAEAS